MEVWERVGEELLVKCCKRSCEGQEDDGQTITHTLAPDPGVLDFLMTRNS